ncbi:glycoside hydrolase family 2 TIM barrel-domain containing protein [Saccharibacillus sp. CPCC 101409]|uniref:beta-mannosidase n=1 Tax=Saccharibacillus sp. CPCC 101409 TaxID=3058041 RepID=UPI002672D785|nr:glycoside hydrolase family 2 protein [Saccharibacillus sp. CPCC 101409]MDO3408815.1 glycoside hydrolase family 2 TIM barrel-domain containing protein [Saccharibacillus sp. CPCC 101409]
MSEAKRQLNDWSFREAGQNDWLPAQVPGCVHSDLYRNGKIADPYYGTNEHDLQWIDKRDWEYESVFTVPGELSGLDNIGLVFDGLDTYADVELNGQRILSADNMFRTWKVPVKNHLAEGDNRLRIRFRSPIEEDLPKLERLGYGLPAANDQSELGGLGDKRVSVFARKAPYHYGWDWGPRFVTSGVWRAVRLEGWSGARITDLFIRQNEVSAERAKLTAVLTIESDRDFEARLRLSADGVRVEHTEQIRLGENTLRVEFEIESPKLWWSRGLGEAHLYTFKAELLEGEDVSAESEVRTGLRSVKLKREPDGAGASFYIELNGVPVFAKGANHIPNDNFNTDVTAERYRYEIVSAAEANMNMLRVWGGGIYEEDVFYELCDEYGIMVWQDFMFACSMYPGDEDFLESVRREAEDNLHRLRNHPSIVLWCGNNEIDSAWAHYLPDGGWGWKKDYNEEQKNRIWADYEAIFHRLLPAAIAKCAPGAEYWPSSPLVSLSSDANQHAHPGTSEGDIHYWGVWHNSEPFENYNKYIGRFMSEYGFQSFPEHKSVLRYAPEEALKLGSEIMLAHQKNGRGNFLIKEYMDKYLPEPKDFVSFLYMSQVLQAEAMKSAIEAHRRRKPYCMGTLYWQMNDSWPVASWSGIDYFGRWKALHYYARRSFRDLSLSIDGTNGEDLNFHFLNDGLEPVSASLRIRLLSVNGEKLHEQTLPVEAPANSASQVYTVKAAELLGEQLPARTLLLGTLEQGGRILDSRTHYFVPGREIELPAPNIAVTRSDDAGHATFTLQTDALAKQVWLSAEAEGVFTDNFFDLIPGEPVTVEFQARRPDGTLASGPAGAVEVKSMADFVKRG